jgi:aminoglycoside 6'-N-acetyltransferase I
MRIVDLRADDARNVHDVAMLLVDTFREHAPDAWPDLESGLAEVRESLLPGRISRIALADDGETVLGWIGGIPGYDGRVWELHPLVVAAAYQRQGIGRALAHDLELLARERGGLTLWAGADDEDGRTTLGGADLYQDLPGQITSVRNLADHPYTFYQRLGFTIVGVMPDANGFGKPDIFLAKRIANSPADRQLGRRRNDLRQDEQD